MPDLNSKYLGLFCWVELETPDIKGAKAFYSELFNWKYKELPSPDGGVYTIGELQHKGICGMTSGNFPQWKTYIFVKNVDEMTQKAEELGATIFDKPTNVGTMGRFSTLEDPTGATFSLWQNLEDMHSEEAFVNNTPGSFCWAELATTDVKTAQKFYSGLFGWIVKDTSSVPDYSIFHRGDDMVSGMIPIKKEWGNMFSQWFVYFSVDDCDNRAEQARHMKATIGVGPKDIPTVGRFCMLKDPQGAHLALIKLLPMEKHKTNQKKK